MMMRAAALFLGQSLAVPAQAAEIVWRSATTGVLPSPAPPSRPASSGFSVTMVGTASIPIGGALDLRPDVVGASGRIVSFLLFGQLPIGATFDAETGKIGGRVFVAGSYPVWVSVRDESGHNVLAAVTLVVG